METKKKEEKEKIKTTNYTLPDRQQQQITFITLDNNGFLSLPLFNVNQLMDNMSWIEYQHNQD